jgi:hypothetical protein
MLLLSVLYISSSEMCPYTCIYFHSSTNAIGGSNINSNSLSSVICTIIIDYLPRSIWLLFGRSEIAAFGDLFDHVTLPAVKDGTAEDGDDGDGDAPSVAPATTAAAIAAERDRGNNYYYDSKQFVNVDTKLFRHLGTRYIVAPLLLIVLTPLSYYVIGWRRVAEASHGKREERERPTIGVLEYDEPNYPFDHNLRIVITGMSMSVHITPPIPSIVITRALWLFRWLSSVGFNDPSLEWITFDSTYGDCNDLQ